MSMHGSRAFEGSTHLSQHVNCSNRRRKTAGYEKELVSLELFETQDPSTQGPSPKSCRTCTEMTHLRGNAYDSPAVLSIPAHLLFWNPKCLLPHPAPSWLPLCRKTRVPPWPLALQQNSSLAQTALDFFWRLRWHHYSNHASNGMHDKQGNKDQDKEQ